MWTVLPWDLLQEINGELITGNTSFSTEDDGIGDNLLRAILIFPRYLYNPYFETYKLLLCV